MSIVEKLMKEFEQKEFTLQQAYEANYESNKESVRARIYENLGVKFEKVKRGVYRSIDSTCLLVEGDGRNLDFLPDSSIECIITDHPYKDEKSHSGGNRNFASYESFQYTQEDFNEKARVLKDGCFLCEFIPAENENNYEYYVELLVTTQQGMTVRAVSHDIIVSLSEETFTAAEVTNYPCEGYIEVKSNITNLLGYTNADFTDGDGVINLTEDGKFVMWGYDPELEEDTYSLTFPTTNMNGYTLMQWSAILEVFNLNDSSSFPYNEEDTSYIFKSVDLANSRGVYLYLRRDGNTVWCELYAVSDLEMLTPTAFVQSNTLTISSDSDTHIYILIRCSRGWYDVLLSTSLPNE